MPITQSAKKALRQSYKRKKANTLRKDAYKGSVKAFRKLITAKKIDEAKTKLAAIYKALDKAVKTDVIKKNKASRLKSRLSRLVK